MPDWHNFVREKIDRLELARPQKKEVAVELAGHLEDLYEQYRRQGVPESSAATRALNEVSDWHDLGRKILRARKKESEMNQRTRAVWIPGLISLAAASAVLTFLQAGGVRPHIVWTRSGMALLFYVPWLLAQPAFGAVGAYISRGNGGNRRERLTASLLPAGAMVGAFCVAFCASIVSNDVTDYKITVISLSVYIVSWAIVPGVALALGALPFLGEKRAQES